MALAPGSRAHTVEATKSTSDGHGLAAGVDICGVAFRRDADRLLQVCVLLADGVPGGGGQ
jgi:hypothetical protein